MIDIYKYSDSSKVIEAWLAELPKGGRGGKAKLAEACRISAAHFSQLLSHERALSPEHGLVLAKEMSFTERETDYFLTLIERQRAGTMDLKARITQKIELLRKENQRVSNRIVKDKELSPETKAVYYSSWTYTGVRNLVAVPGFQTADAIASRLAISREVVTKVLEFLLEHDLCARDKSGEITYGPAWTHLDGESPLSRQHQQNWRFRGLNIMELRRSSDLFFTSPMSMSDDVAKEIRELLPGLIQSIQKKVAPSPSETVRCLNIDWFEY
jgi:uncharacterized protein (TIGR02147 family)